MTPDTTLGRSAGCGKTDLEGISPERDDTGPISASR